MAVRTVMPGGGGDHASLAAWEAFVQGTFTEIETAECYDGVDSTSCTIDGSITTSSFYHRVMAAAGDQAAMPYSSTAYRLEVAGNCLVVSDPNARVERIQVTCTASAATRYCVRVTESNVTIDGCFIRANGSSTALIRGISIETLASTTSFARNCVSLHLSNGDDGFRAEGGGVGATARFYNCTAIGWVNGFNKVSRTGVAKNCLSHGSTTSDFAGTWDTGTEYNASEDATAPGTNSRTNQTFTFVNAAGGDYHLASSDAGAKDFGVNLSSDPDLPVTVDFDNVARSAPFDIGATEVQSGAAPGDEGAYMPQPAPLPGPNVIVYS